MKCVNIEYVNESYDLCDLEIDGGNNNYVAEGVVVHNTFCQVVALPYRNECPDGEHIYIEYEKEAEQIKGYVAVSSKGLGAKGLFLKHNEKNEKNVYIRATSQYFKALVEWATYYDRPITMCGEVFGDGVQDLKYGMLNQIAFRCFDVYVGYRGQGYWFDDISLTQFCETLSITRVPVLYRGPYSNQIVQQLTQHTKSVFDSKQVREGIVIKPINERQHKYLGRVVLKSINEDYYVRKNATEYN